jgi:hypothetical protein
MEEPNAFTAFIRFLLKLRSTENEDGIMAIEYFLEDWLQCKTDSERQKMAQVCLQTMEMLHAFLDYLVTELEDKLLAQQYAKKLLTRWGDQYVIDLHLGFEKLPEPEPVVSTIGTCTSWMNGYCNPKSHSTKCNGHHSWLPPLGTYCRQPAKLIGGKVIPTCFASCCPFPLNQHRLVCPNVYNGMQCTNNCKFAHMGWCQYHAAFKLDKSKNPCKFGDRCKDWHIDPNQIGSIVKRDFIIK